MGKVSDKLKDKGAKFGLTPNDDESSQSFSHRIREAQKAGTQAAKAVANTSRKLYWRRR